MAVMNSVANFDSKESSTEVLEYLRKNRTIVRELSVSEIYTDQDVQELDESMKESGPLLQLHSLKLPNNRLTSLSSTAIASIVSATETLQELDLSNNKVKAFGSNLVEALTNSNCALKVLNLHNNQLGAAGASHIASIIRLNTSINDLNIGRNKLGKKSALKAITASLMTNPYIQKLDLSHNGIDDKGCSKLAELLDPNPVGIQNKSRIQSLNLASNKIGPSGAKQLAGGLLESNKSLKHLNLAQNHIKAEGAEAIAVVLKYNYTLTELILSQNVIQDEGVQYICQGLEEAREVSGNSALKVLDLEWNLIHDEGTNAIANYLKSNDTLEYLNLKCNGIKDEGAIALAQAFCADRALVEIDLVGNQIRDKGATALAEHLSKPECLHPKDILWSQNLLSKVGEDRLNSAIQFRKNRNGWLGRSLGEIERRRSVSLNFAERVVSDYDVIAIASKLAENPTRVPVMLFKGPLVTHRGVKALALKVLARNNSDILRLFLVDTKIGDIGLQALSSALQRNTSLQVLSLINCGITESGALHLAEALPHNRHLTRLDLSGNEIGDSGCQAILSSTLEPAHESLISLNLSRNGISDYGLRYIPSFKSLQEFSLEGNDITDAGALDIAKACMSQDSRIWRLSLRQTKLTWKGIQTIKLFLPLTHMFDHDEAVTESNHY